MLYPSCWLVHIITIWLVLLVNVCFGYCHRSSTYDQRLWAWFDMTLWVFEYDFNLMNWIWTYWMMIEWVTLSMIAFFGIYGLWINPWLVKALFPPGVLPMVLLDTLLIYNDVSFIPTSWFESFMHIPINILKVVSWQGLRNMVEMKWLDDKGAYKESCKIISWDKGDMGSDNLHLGVPTKVNQSDFNNHLYVFLNNPCGHQWKGLSWPINKIYSI